MKKYLVPLNILFLPASALADSELVDPGPVDNLGEFILNIVDIFLIIIGALAIFFIVYSGVKLITSAGNPTRVKSAKLTLFWSVVGLVVVVLSYVILNFIVTSVENIAN